MTGKIYHEVLTWWRTVCAIHYMASESKGNNATKKATELQKRLALQRWIRRAEIYRRRGKHSGNTASSCLEGLLERKLKKNAITWWFGSYTIRGNSLQEKWRNSTCIIPGRKRTWSPNQTKCLQGTNSTRRFNKRVSHLNNFLLIWSF